MAPLESADRRVQGTAETALPPIQRIHDATGSLEQKIAGFEASLAALERDKAQLAQLLATLRAASAS